MGELCFELSKKIIESGKEFDRIIALAKGGWTWARAVSDYTKIQNVGSIQYEFYADIYKTSKGPKLKQPLPISVKGEKLLILDDVADSGATLRTLLARKKGWRVVTLYRTVHSAVQPDLSCRIKKKGDWVIFPWETDKSSR